MSAETTPPDVTSTSGSNTATSDGPVAIQTGDKGTTVVATPGAESGRGDVSASTIARMMGMATAAEFRVLEGKVDLLATKMNSITAKLERITSTLANVPSGSDLERIDVQISSMRTSLDGAVVSLGQTLEEGIKKMQRAAREQPKE